MEGIHLSKSKYCKAKQCNKALWLLKNNPKVATQIDNQAILDNGTEVLQIANEYLQKY